MITDREIIEILGDDYVETCRVYYRDDETPVGYNAFYTVNLGICRIAVKNGTGRDAIQRLNEIITNNPGSRSVEITTAGITGRIIKGKKTISETAIMRICKMDCIESVVTL